MALTPEEQRELEQLNSEAMQSSASSLSPQEQAELDALNEEAAQAAVPLPTNADSNRGRSFFDGAVRTLDSYTGAPSRAAVGAAQEGHNPIDAFKRQFGSDPDYAPSGKAIVEKAGVPDKEMPPVALPLLLARSYGYKPSYSDVAGVGMDVAADWTNLIPFVGPAKKFIQGTKAAEEVSAGAKAVASGVKGAAEKAASKTASAMTGVSEQAIKTYAESPEAIKAMAKEAGGDISVAADNVRQSAQKKIQATRKALNEQVETALSASRNVPASEVNLSVQKVVDSLEAAKGKLDPRVRADQAASAQIDDLIAQVKDLATGEGKTNAYDMHRIKEILQDAAKPSYDAGRNPIFQGGPRAASAAKGAAGEARVLVNQAAPEAYAKANKQLERLHRLEEQLNKNLINPGKTESSLLAAGSGSNSRNRRLLSLLDESAGTNLGKQSEQLSAMRSFGDPSILPVDTTGKAPGRTLISSGLGALIGGVPGAIAAGAMTSPTALKAAIDAGHISADVVKALAGGVKSLNEATIKKAFDALQTAKGQAIFESFQNPAWQDMMGARQLNRAPADKQNERRMKALEE